jgi:tetratricopeptide (TPR) repeat protein
MSLLLDALKRAAQEKLEKERQDGEAQSSAADTPLSLDITEMDAAAAAEGGDADLPSSTDDLRLHRADVLASELEAFMGRNSTEQQVSRPRDSGERVSTMAAAKSFVPDATFTGNPAPTPAAAARLFRNKRAGIMQSKQGMLAAVAAGVLLLIGIFYIVSFNKMNASNVRVDRLQADTRTPAVDAPVDNTKIEAGLLAEQEPIGTLLEETPVAGKAPVAATNTADTGQPVNLFGGQQASAAETPDNRAEPAPARRTTAPRISVQKSRKEPLHDILLRAYNAYQSNDLAAAEAGYRQALARAPENRDALLGFAATAIQSGDYAAAMETYTQLLNLDPNDDLALAGIAGLKHSVQGVTMDLSAIKRLLQKRPESAQLHFALGNVHSAAADWPKAQSAYFDAHRFDAQNPDYAYNLAVSLEHLQQAAAALRYYELALSLADDRNPNFDSGQVAARISTLQTQNSATDAR